MRPVIALLLLVPGPGLAADDGVPGQFPPVAEILGDRRVPLPAVDADDLRDAPAEPPSFAAELAALRSAVPDRQRAAIQRLSDARAPYSAAYVTALLLRTDTAPAVRVAAASGLGRIGFAGSAPALRIALNDPDQRVRFASALALGRLGTEPAAAALAGVLLGDDHWWVRYAAAVALGTARRRESVPALARTLREDTLWQMRQQAARALGEIGGPAAAWALMGGLAAEEAAVRHAAARALAEAASPEIFDDLHAAYGVERDPLVRNQLRRALARAGR